MAAASTTPRSLRPSKRPASAPPRAACACAASYGGWRSDRAERRMWLWREPRLDRVAGAQIPADQDDGHDARLADDDSSSVPAQHGLQQARLEVVYLIAGVAQAGDLDHGLRTQAQPSAGRQREQGDAAGGDVLAHVARRYGEPGGTQLVVQLSVDQMDLAQVGLAGVARYPRSVLHCAALMRVAFHSEALDQPDHRARLLAEGMRRVAADGRHDAPRRILVSQAGAEEGHRATLIRLPYRSRC